MQEPIERDDKFIPRGRHRRLQIIFVLASPTRYHLLSLENYSPSRFRSHESEHEPLARKKCSGMGELFGSKRPEARSARRLEPTSGSSRCW